MSLPCRLVPLVVCLSAMPACAVNRPATDPPVGGHVCTEIAGPPSLALTSDWGKTLVQSRTPRDGLARVEGVVALGTPNALVALIGNHRQRGVHELYLSVDGGCHWESRGNIAADHLFAGRDGVAYAVGPELYAISARDVEKRATPPESFQGLAVDETDPKHVRSLGHQHVFDSTDRGATWVQIADLEVGEVDRPGGIVFGGRGLDQIVAMGSPERDPRETHDGGRHWVTSTGCPHCYNGVFAPDGRTVWGLGMQLFRSTDGGATFALAANPFPPNGVLLVGSHPDPDTLLLSQGGTVPSALVRVDLRSLTSIRQELPLLWDLKEEHDPHVSEHVVAATFVPGAPGLVCLGIDREVIGSPPPGVETAVPR